MLDMGGRMPKKRNSARKKPAQQKRPEEKAFVFWPFGLLIFSALLFADQYSKSIIVSDYALHQPVKVLPGLWFTYVQNTGITWGFMQGVNEAMIWLSVTVFGLLLYFYDKFETVIEKICYTLLLAGLWGNLLDRGIHGFVIDFIDVGWWPVFNIADACITTGVIVLILEQIRKSRQEHA